MMRHGQNGDRIRLRIKQIYNNLKREVLYIINLLYLFVHSILTAFFIYCFTSRYSIHINTQSHSFISRYHKLNKINLFLLKLISTSIHFLIPKSMKVRPQRTHYMGFSNRNPSLTTNNKNDTINILENSFNKTKSQYCHTSNKLNSISPMNHNINHLTNNLQHSSSPKVYTSHLNINTIYKSAQKGHHHQFENKNFSNKKGIENLYQQQTYLNPSPLNFNKQLNSKIRQIKQNLGKRKTNEQITMNKQMKREEQVNIYKIEQLKRTFLRNNQKRRNLSEYFDKYKNKVTGKVDQTGFRKLIKQYGYHINDSEIDLMFQLNSLPEERGQQSQINYNNSNSINNSTGNSNSQIDLPQFINLMSKQNVYFETIKLPSSVDKNMSQPYRFKPAEFEILRNKYPKLKEAFKIYNNEPITKAKFEKVMKKLDITDLLIKEQDRLSIFDCFSTNNQLNLQQLLGLIATQEHERVSKQKNMRTYNNDQFLLNIPVNQQYQFQKHHQNDPLLQLLYPSNLKKASIVEYQKSINQVKQICNCLKQIQNNSQRNLVEQIIQNDKRIQKDQLYKRVQRLLQSEGYNFNLKEYKSFISYIDFDSANTVSPQKLETYIFKQDEAKRVNRLDRRVRNQDKGQKLLKNQEGMSERKTEDDFVERMRTKSSGNWNTLRKTFIKQGNVTEFKVPTKFSAWPSRLYEIDQSLMQAQDSFGMGIGEYQRFQKDGKHSLGQQERMNRLLKYQNKVRRAGEWQELNNKKVQQMSKVQQRKERSKLYNMRLLKEQYQERCHSNSFAY